MKTSLLHTARHIIDGTLLVFLAEALILPTGLLTVAFLTRRLGPQGYGLFALAAAVVIWFEGTINTFFSRPTLKFIAEAKDWRPVGAAILRLHLLASLIATVLLWFLSVPISTMLNEPVLAEYLRLFALHIPLSNVTNSHKNFLVGIGGFRRGAVASAAHWVARLCLIVLFVELGFSVNGAIWGSIGASVVHLAVSRVYVRPTLRGATGVQLPGFWSYAWPLVVFSIGTALAGRLDLFALKLLGGTASEVGIYGAAQALAIIPTIFAMSFAPLLLSTLSRLVGAGDIEQAKEVAFHGMRLVLILLPFAGMTAGMSHEVVHFIFGPLFRPAAPLLSWLIFGALAMLMVSVATAVLTASGKPKWTMIQVIPLLFVGVVGYFLLIPRMGPVGASVVKTCCAFLAAITSLVGVYRIWRIFPPLTTLARSLFVCGLAWGLAVFWPTPGVWLCLKAAAISVVIVTSFVSMGEFTAVEIRLALSMVRWRSVPKHSFEL
jgi:O-antigen/teichoic acid export membrane protein